MISLLEVAVAAFIAGSCLSLLLVFERPMRKLLAVASVGVFVTSSLLICAFAHLSSHMYFLPAPTREMITLWFCSAWYQLLHFYTLWARGLSQSMDRGRIYFKPGTETAITSKLPSLWISNHQDSQLDWVTFVELSYALGREPTSARAFMKSAFYWIPIIGWISLAQGAIALSRSWKKDESFIRNQMAKLGKSRYPVSFTMYPEGTRLTPKKLKLAQDFAKQRGLVVLKNVLQPRVKGFCLAVESARKCGAKYLFDITAIMTPKPANAPDLFLAGNLHQTDVFLEAFRLDELPESAQDLALWLRNRWVLKDAMMEKYITQTHSFEGNFINFSNKFKTSITAYIVSLCIYAMFLPLFFSPFLVTLLVSPCLAPPLYVLYRMSHPKAVFRPRYKKDD